MLSFIRRLSRSTASQNFRYITIRRLSTREFRIVTSGGYEESHFMRKQARKPEKPFSTMNSLSQYEFIDGAEPLGRYTGGGYHPTEIGQVLHERYEIVDKLGYGGWALVWLAHDRQSKQLVALKVAVAKSLPHEAEILQALASPSAAACLAAIPRVLDEFSVKGPNGCHPCYTTSPALCTLRQSGFSRLFSVEVARALAYELTLAVAYVHSRGFVHGDIHLRNVFLRAPQALQNLSIQQFHEAYGRPVSYPVERLDGLPLTSGVPSTVFLPVDMSKNARDLTLPNAHLLLGDFGEAFAPDEEPRLDIWSLATATWDILGMQALFSSAFYSDSKVRCQIVDTLGPLLADWEEKWIDRPEYFDDQGAPKYDRYVWPRLDQAFEERVQKFRREDDMGVFSDDETMAILTMMAGMLKFKPEERLTIEQVLASDWMVKWARPTHDQSQDI